MTTDHENGLDLEALIAGAGQIDIQRLEGDDLYLWAKLISEMEHLQKRVNQVGRKLLVKYGRGDPRYILTDEGYIMTEETLRSQQREEAPRD